MSGVTLASRAGGRRTMFAAVVVAALTLASVVAAQEGRRFAGVDEAVADIAARVQAQTGPAPADCGRFFSLDHRTPAAADLEHALDCARTASSRRSPFWLLVGGRGVDSWIAQGLLGGPDGVIRRFYYDSAPSGGADDSPEFATARCWLPGVHTYASDTVDLECANDVWKLVVNAVTLLISGVALLFGVSLARRGLAQSAAAVLLVAGGIVAVLTGSLAYVGAGRWITTVPAVMCVAGLLLMARRTWPRSLEPGRAR